MAGILVRAAEGRRLPQRMGEGFENGLDRVVVVFAG
jgi:hypothetical protein